VIAFWREAGRDKWFKKDTDFDRAIGERFKSTHAEAAAGRLKEWASTADGALALVLVLDQFSRNMFRGSPAAFAQDQLAVDVANHAVDSGFDKQVAPEMRMFFYMPFMHSETIAAQERCVLAFHAISPGNISYAREHERIIRRFGRFPHRNPMLGRHTTPAEQAFLDGGGFAG
jgi:uncharacterized protein (DUF924 family)